MSADPDSAAPPRRIFVIAAEPSGDALGGELVAALRARLPDLALAGVGGPALAAAGLQSRVPIDGLSVLGIAEALSVIRLVKKRVALTAQAVAAFRPDLVVLIDSWGFTLRAARAIRDLLPDVPLVKMVGPQVWATRPGRARTVADAYDALLCIHAFETPFYAGLDLPVTVIGNPAVSREPQGDGAAFRARHGLEGRRLLLMLPGSRGSEIARVSPVFEATARRLCAARSDLTVVTAVSANVDAAVRARAAGWDFPAVLVDDSEKADAFAAADVSLACSGTVTTEVGLNGVPVVVGYRLGWITWAIARAFLLKSRWVTLMNVAAGAEIAPEFIQTRCTPPRLEAAVGRLLDDHAARAAQRAAQDAALLRMGRHAAPAADRAADAVLAMLA